MGLIRNVFFLSIYIIQKAFELSQPFFEPNQEVFAKRALHLGDSDVRKSKVDKFSFPYVHL